MFVILLKNKIYQELLEFPSPVMSGKDENVTYNNFFGIPSVRPEWIVEIDVNRVSLEGNGTPLQYSCLENPMDGGAWQAAVRGVAESRTRLSDFTFTFHFYALEKEMATHSSVLAWRIPGTGSLVGCHLWGRTESDTTEATQQQQQQQGIILILLPQTQLGELMSFKTAYQCFKRITTNKGKKSLQFNQFFLELSFSGSIKHIRKRCWHFPGPLGKLVLIVHTTLKGPGFSVAIEYKTLLRVTQNWVEPDFAT